MMDKNQMNALTLIGFAIALVGLMKEAPVWGKFVLGISALAYLVLGLIEQFKR